MTESGRHLPRTIEQPYVERVRFSWERKLETALANVDNTGKHRPEDRPHSLVRLTEASAPRVYRVAREVAETLRFAERFVLFQTPALDHMNACAYCDEDPFAVRLIGPAISLLDDLALRAMIGHEFGHYLAHGTASAPDSCVLSLASTWYGTPMGTACSVSAELTADRLALLACQDLAATVRLEVVSGTLLPADSLGLRENEYLADVCNQIVEGSVAKVSLTHPSREFRLYASWLFSRCDEYRRLTGSGPGEMTLAEVDDCLEEQLITPQLETALALLDKERARPRRTKPKRESPRPYPPAAPVGTPIEAVPIGERLIERARAIVGDLAERARKPSKAVSRPDPSEAPEIDSSALEQRFQNLERATLDEIERRFEELERVAAKSDESK